MWGPENCTGHWSGVASLRKRWLTLFAVLVLATMLTWLCFRRSQHEIRFEQIRIGMALSEVEAIVVPTDECVETEVVKAWGYNDGWRRVTIIVTLDANGRVVDKHLRVTTRDDLWHAATHPAKDKRDTVDRTAK